MNDTTPLGRRAKPFTRLWTALDNLIFRRPDLDAVVRGWQVRRDRPFHRIYRDPRWDTVGVRSTGTDAVGVR